MTAGDSTLTFFEKLEAERAVFKGIEAHYETHVTPVLEEMDKERESTLTTALICQGILVTVSFLLVILLSASGNGFGLLFVIIPTIVLMFLTWSFSTKTFVTHAKTALIGGMVSFFEWTYSVSCEEPEIFKRLTKLKFFCGFDSDDFSDQIKGTAFGKAFSITEIYLTRTDTTTTTDHNGHMQTETTTTTVFDGCLISVGVEKKFTSETIVLRKGFLFNPSKVKGLSRVGFASSKFETVFNAYSSDQVEARYLLEPTLIEQIIAYENAYKGQSVRFAFIDQELHIVIETGSRFEFKHMSESLLSKYRIQSLLREIAATFDLIEGLIEKRPDDWKEEFGHDAFLTKQELADKA